METKIILSNKKNENLSVLKSQFNDSKILVISDKKVDSIYKDYFPYNNLVLDCGEKIKDYSNVEKVLKFFTKNNLRKSDVVIAFGGGATTDLVGFCCSIYKRGINLINYPTTLLSMVDASIGGKNAVNLFDIKNCVGGFLQPAFVFIDKTFLKTLNEKEYKSGIGEIIKYAVLGAENLYNLLDNPKDNIDEIISSCVEYKTKITKKDPYDLGIRHLLNLGHTFGHAIESFENFEFSHGEAVVSGLLKISKFSLYENLISNEEFQKINELIKKLNFQEKEYKISDLILYIKDDKKISSNKIDLVLPIKKDKCIIKEYELEKFYEVAECI